MSCNSQKLSVFPNDSVNSIWVDVVSALQFDLFNTFSVECPCSVHLHQWHRSVRVFDEPWCKTLDEVDEHECAQLHNFNATRRAGLLLKVLYHCGFCPEVLKRTDQSLLLAATELQSSRGAIARQLHLNPCP